MEVTQSIKDKVVYLAEHAYNAQATVLGKFRNYSFTGCSRTVVIDKTERVVYKLALRGHGAQDNRTEWRIWKTLPPSAQLITAQPLDISECGMVLAMEFIGETLARSDDKLMIKEINFIRKDFNAYLSLCLLESFTKQQAEDMMVDNHTDNMAYREDGSLAWIDYGGLE